MRRAALLTTLALAACVRFGYDGAGGSGGGAPTLEVVGPEAVELGVCHRATVRLVDADGAPAVPGGEVVVDLAATSGLGTFADPDCSSPRAEVRLVPPATSAAFWLRADGGGDLRLEIASGAGDAALALEAFTPRWVDLGVMSAEPRHRAGIAFDPGLARLLLYGGGSHESPARADLWAWDGAAWTEICDPCPPGARIGHGVAFDAARGRLLVFGGADAMPPTQLHGDLWAWSGAAWTDLGSTGPAPRTEVSLAMEPGATGRAHLFGGLTASGPSDELWTLTGDTWTPVRRAGPWPAARNFAGVAYDAGAARLVVYGGMDGAAAFDDAWAWDGAAWTQICGACTGEARYATPLAYYPPGNTVVLTAGYGTGELQGSWRLDGPAFTFVAAEPPQRDSMALTYDSVRHRLVAVGGNGDSCGDGDCGDLWSFTP